MDVFTAIRYHTELDKAGRLLALNNRRHLRTAKAMNALFRDAPMLRKTR
jgi:error-prone DNA polymerase